MLSPPPRIEGEYIHPVKTGSPEAKEGVSGTLLARAFKSAAVAFVDELCGADDAPAARETQSTQRPLRGDMYRRPEGF